MSASRGRPDRRYLAERAAVAEARRRRRAADRIFENVASLDDFAVQCGDEAHDMRDDWAATVRVAHARRELGLDFGEDMDPVYGLTRGRHVPTTYTTVSWARLPGHVLSFPPGEPLPDDLAAKLDEIDSLITVPVDQLDDRLQVFGLDPAQMPHNQPNVAGGNGSTRSTARNTLLAPHVVKLEAALARLVIGPGRGEVARAEVWAKVGQLVGRFCDPEAWFNQGLVNFRALYSLCTEQDGTPFPADELKLLMRYEDLEEVMRCHTDEWRAAEADISGH
ncbi:hypothetical protein ISU10_02500 [Nocardioides agariphilus]|uniref:Uncharacterized protein n=1 Tax=Nocardioides agariphilus TaxID=433664 RepID=A0A930YNH0_9ACTN|nr:hypothetical protein [Nocardioides agariphilus]MBF4766635.1 hypothetical protein [Nocardioides agariphilus]